MNLYALQIAGQHLTVRSSAPAERVERLAAQLDERVRTFSAHGAAPLTATLLAALSLEEALDRATAALDEADAQTRADATALLAHAEVAAQVLAR